MTSICWAVLPPAAFYLFKMYKTSQIRLSDRDHISSLTPRINDLLHSLGVQQETFLCDNTGAFSKRSDMSVVVGSKQIIIFSSKAMLEADPEGFCFVLKHEIAHILGKHGNREYQLGFINSVFWGTILGYFLPLYLSLPLNVFFSVGGTNLKVKEFEEAADDWAISHSSLEEIKGGLRYFKVEQAFERMVKGNGSDKKLLEMLEKDKTPSEEFDVFHPKLSSRIKKLQQALRARGIDPKLDDTDYVKIKNLIHQHYLQEVLRDNPQMRENLELQENLENTVLATCLFGDSREALEEGKQAMAATSE